jgi:hypothetical protein
MPSQLTWIDHDNAARERSLKILALFQERESRDELGLGGVRDSISDQLFPGTSTIQTRLRYMLFVPWIYRKLEIEKVPPGEFAARADRMERFLVGPLLAADDRSGVFGKTAGKGIKRLPSSVYWSAFGSWGIRLMNASQDEYHRQIGVLYHRRAEQRARDAERAKNGDDSDSSPAPGTLSWHPRLPSPPIGFPDNVTFSLSQEEASFLLDRIQRSHPESLLAHLALHCTPVDVSAPWLHPDQADFSTHHRELLTHGRLFSDVMHGAALIYNIALSKLGNRDDKVQDYQLAFAQWHDSLNQDEIRAWGLPRLWELVIDHGHTITPATRLFIERWQDLLVSHGAAVLEKAEAIELIRRRERSLKKGRSRFDNRRALDQWKGASGLGRMVYRWSTAKVFLKDLHDGLSKETVHAES